MTDTENAFQTAPYRPAALAPAKVNAEYREDGSILLTSPIDLGDYYRQVGEPLRHWAEAAPDRVWLAERDASGAWRSVTYGEGRALCDRLSQALLDRGLGPGRPLVILSENSVNFGLLSVAAMQVGIPFAPVSPAYSLMSRDFSRLKPIFEQLEPGMVYVEDGVRFETALRALPLDRVELVVTRDPPPELAATPFDDLAATDATGAVDAAFDSVTADVTAKYLFTSGSTGTPKAVINTHRMLCANQQMNRLIMPFVDDVPPVIVDWLPWNHTAAGNQMFNVVLFNGGSYYLDAGRPAPGLFDTTLKNLRDVSPTIYFNVPAGFAALLPHLENDPELRTRFFKDLVFVWYAGAALTQDLWDRFERVAYQALGERVVMTSGFGTTESSPSLTFAHWPGSRLGNVGIPLPGMQLKLAPVGDKMEIRAKGVCITPGYYKDIDLTAKAFDEEGYYRFGDAMKLIDRERPELGMLFDGRLSENFKLSSGTWVNVGTLRTEVIAAAAPVFQDLIVCGHDRDAIGILAWPAPAGCREVAGAAEDSDPESLFGHPALRAAIVERLRKFNAGAGGSSRRIARVMLMSEPPQIDANEITDKGYINQRAARERRADLVETLFSTPAPDAVIEIT